MRLIENERRNVYSARIIANRKISSREKSECFFEKISLKEI
jgi:hypothetical protein